MRVFWAIVTVLSVLLSFDCSGGHSLTVSNGWARAAAQGENTQLYFLIQNNTKDPDTLTSVESTTGASPIYKMSLVDGITAPEEVKGLTVQPGKELQLKPGGTTYVQLTSISQALVPGATIHVKLNFATAGTVEQSIQIQPATDKEYAD